MREETSVGKLKRKGKLGRYSWRCTGFQLDKSNRSVCTPGCTQHRVDVACLHAVCTQI